MERIPDLILRAGNRLFWDVDPQELDPKRHEDFIMGRVLSDGTAEMVWALREAVGDDGLRDFVKRAPHRLDARSRRFFQVVLGVTPAVAEEPAPCTTTPFRRNNDALFTP